MSKRLSIVFGVMLAVMLGLVVWRASGPREPVFEGRTLTSWLDHHVASSAAMPPFNSPGWRKADEALRTIGSKNESYEKENRGKQSPFGSVHRSGRSALRRCRHDKDECWCLR